jgi:hypothetical protein
VTNFGEPIEFVSGFTTSVPPFTSNRLEWSKACKIMLFRSLPYNSCATMMQAETSQQAFEIVESEFSQVVKEGWRDFTAFFSFCAVPECKNCTARIFLRPGGSGER